MKFQPTPIKGAFTVALEPRGDERGFFARLFCGDELRKAGLEPVFAQANDSLSRLRGTLRGLHYQRHPMGEAKLIRCVRGAVFDVLVDLRHDSPSYKTWFGTELTDENRLMMYVPPGCAHGYLTLADDSELIYFASSPYAPAHEGVVRWDDPAFGIAWPLAPTTLSPKDAAAPDYRPEAHQTGY